MTEVAVAMNDSFNKTAGSSINGEEKLVKILHLLFYSLIVAVGSVGNAIICTAILTRKKRKTSEYFILNLAIADFATCAISIPLDIIEQVTEHWPYGSFLCHLVYPFQTILMAVSVATLLAMSLERHRAIMYPLKPRITRTVTVVVIGIIWIGSVLLVSPYIRVLTLKNSECQENWPGDDPRPYAMAFTLSVFVILYACPLLGLSAAYLTVARKLYRDINSVEGVLTCHESNPTDCNDQRTRRARRNMHIIKIFAAAVVTFALCMLPNHIIWLWKDFSTGGDSPHFNNLLLFAQIMVYSNSSINPFIFGTLHVGCLRCKGFTRSSRGRPKPNDARQKYMSMRVSFSSSSKLRVTTVRRASPGCRANDAVVNARPIIEAEPRNDDSNRLGTHPL